MFFLGEVAALVLRVNPVVISVKKKKDNLFAFILSAE